MNNKTATEFLFPTLSSVIIFFLWFSILYQRPVAGILIGFIIGLLISIITMIISEPVHRRPKEWYTDNDKQSIIDIPLGFFKIWGSFLFDIGSCLLIVLSILGVIALIFYLIFFMGC